MEAGEAGLSAKDFIGPLITAGAIVISAAVAIALAWWNSKWTKAQSRTLITYTTLNERGWDKDYITARSMFISAKNSGSGFLEEVQNDLNPIDAEEVDQSILTMESAVRLIMNDYERMFIAIERGVLDIQFVKDWHLNTIIDDYEKTKTYVQWMRDRLGNSSIYEVFQRNAENWKRERDSNSNGAHH